MTNTVLARELHTATAIIPHPVITVDDDGIILEIVSDKAACRDEETILTPTFLDIHIHGAAGHDLMRESPAEIARVQGFLAHHGVGHYLPTTVTAPVDDVLRSLEALADAIELPAQLNQAKPVGIHLEGPFLSHEKRGVHTECDLRPPTIELFERLQQAARGHIRLVTLSPETPGALDLIAHCKQAGVRTSMGHTNATSAQAEAAIAAGASSATHTFNAMRPIDHRESGVLGTVLTTDELYAELICDGVHVGPEAVRLFHRAKGTERAILVTDGTSATGMGDGHYKLGNMDVVVTGSRCLLAGTETLAGSVLTLDQAVRNYSGFTGLHFAKAALLASRNPARMLDLNDGIGTVSVGHPASFNRYDAQGNLLATYFSSRSTVAAQTATQRALPLQS